MVESGGLLPRETGPRLLRMKRLSLLSTGPASEEDLEGSAQNNRLSLLIRPRPKGKERAGISLFPLKLLL